MNNTILLFLKTGFLVMLSSFFAHCKVTKSIPNPKWDEYYKDQLHKDSKLISAGPNRTVEFVSDLYLVKEYFYDTKVITSKRRFRDINLTVPIGNITLYNDNGIKYYEGSYKKLQLHGLVTLYDIQKGWKSSEYFYKKGKLEGKATSFDSTGRITLITNYRRGELNGEEVQFDTAGNVKYRATWKQGKKIALNGNVFIPVDDERLPAFPCDSLYVDAANCSEKSLQAYLSKNINYPPDAFKLDIQGSPKVSFVIGHDGTVHNICVYRGLCKSISEECYRVVANMPPWIPGSVNGEPIKVTYTLPLHFRLQ